MLYQWCSLRYALLQSRLNPLNLCKWVNIFINLHAAGYKICKYEPPHTRCKAFCPGFYLSLPSFKNLTVQRDLYKEIFARQSLICVWKKCVEDAVSFLSHSKKLRDFRGIINNLFISTVFYDNRICLHWFHQSSVVIAIPRKR